MNEKSLMYIHGYGSDGNATKGQLLRKMFPEWRVVSPTFDYDHCTPWQIQKQISETVEAGNVGLIVGSSFGGYMALCATDFFHGTVWAINPVHDVVPTIQRVILNQAHTDNGNANKFIEMYEEFDRQVFRKQAEANKNASGNYKCSQSHIYFALSTDDELLGDHKPLLDLFPCHDQVVWKDKSGHHFLRFEELADAIAASLSKPAE